MVAITYVSDPGGAPTRRHSASHARFSGVSLKAGATISGVNGRTSDPTLVLARGIGPARGGQNRIELGVGQTKRMAL